MLFSIKMWVRLSPFSETNMINVIVMISIFTHTIVPVLGETAPDGYSHSKCSTVQDKNSWIQRTFKKVDWNGRETKVYKTRIFTRKDRPLLFKDSRGKSDLDITTHIIEDIDCKNDLIKIKTVHYENYSRKVIDLISGQVFEGVETYSLSKARDLLLISNVQFDVMDDMISGSTKLYFCGDKDSVRKCKLIWTDPTTRVTIENIEWTTNGFRFLSSIKSLLSLQRNPGWKINTKTSCDVSKNKQVKCSDKAYK